MDQRSHRQRFFQKNTVPATCVQTDYIGCGRPGHRASERKAHGVVGEKWLERTRKMYRRFGVCGWAAPVFMHRTVTEGFCRDGVGSLNWRTVTSVPGPGRGWPGWAWGRKPHPLHHLVVGALRWSPAVGCLALRVGKCFRC